MLALSPCLDSPHYVLVWHPQQGRFYVESRSYCAVLDGDHEHYSGHVPLERAKGNVPAEILDTAEALAAEWRRDPQAVEARARPWERYA
jgi:hypothetical protein